MPFSRPVRIQQDAECKKMIILQETDNLQDSWLKACTMCKSLHYVKCCNEKLSNSVASCLSEQETVAMWTIVKDDARAIVSRYE